MRLVKALVALTALGLASLVFAGASSASVLCEVAGEGACPGEALYPANTEFSGKLAEETVALFATPLANVECKSSAIELKTTSEEAEPLPGEVTGLTFSGCATGGGTSCTLTPEYLPYSANFASTGEEGDGTLSVSSGGSGAPSIKLVCGSLLSCTGSSEKLTFAFEGGEPASVVVSEASLAHKGLLCPKTIKFTAAYVLTEPEEGEAYLDQGPALMTKLCKAVPGLVNNILTCPGNNNVNAYTGAFKSSLEATQSATFTSSVGPTGIVSCNQVQLLGEFNANGSSRNGGVTSFTFNTNNGNCTSTIVVNGQTPPVAVSLPTLPYRRSSVEFRQPISPQANLIFDDANAVILHLTIKAAGGDIVCAYSRNLMFGQVVNGSATEISKLGISGTWHAIPVQPGACPLTVLEVARLTFEMAAGGNLYVANQ